MGIAEGRPPYAADEIDRIAGAHIAGEAWGIWFATHEAATVFQRPINRLPLDARCKMIADGILWLYEFGSWTVDPHSKGGPRFETMRWLDAPSLKTMLKLARKKLREMPEFMKPWMSGTWLQVVKEWQTEEVIDTLVDNYDRARARSVPKAYRRAEDLVQGRFDPVASKIAMPQTYTAGEEGR